MWEEVKGLCTVWVTGVMWMIGSGTRGHRKGGVRRGGVKGE